MTEVMEKSDNPCVTCDYPGTCWFCDSVQLGRRPCPLEGKQKVTRITKDDTPPETKMTGPVFRRLKFVDGPIEKVEHGVGVSRITVMGKEFFFYDKHDAGVVELVKNVVIGQDLGVIYDVSTGTGQDGLVYTKTIIEDVHVGKRNCLSFIRGRTIRCQFHDDCWSGGKIKPNNRCGYKAPKQVSNETKGGQTVFDKIAEKNKEEEKAEAAKE